MFDIIKICDYNISEEQLKGGCHEQKTKITRYLEQPLGTIQKRVERPLEQIQDRHYPVHIRNFRIRLAVGIWPAGIGRQGHISKWEILVAKDNRHHQQSIEREKMDKYLPQIITFLLTAGSCWGMVTTKLKNQEKEIEELKGQVEEMRKDHDLLIRVDTKVDGITETLKEMKDLIEKKEKK